jgi:two-component system, NarL family, nitrate/nitrite response regulator NarL
MNEPTPSGHVLVVDGDAEGRAVAASALGRGGYSILEAASGEEALEIARRDPLALAVVEVCLPGICGYELLRELRDEFGAGLPVVLVSGTRIESVDRVAGLLLGADDYLLKPLAADELLIKVRRLLTRNSPLAPSVAARLTRREREVLGLLAEGLNPEEIAQRLFISRKTVGTHVEHIFHKLGVHSRAEAIALAYHRNGRTSLV